jgi:hypothetical protein
LGNGGYVLNPSSDWYKLLGPFACGGGKSNCTNACTGLQAVGGVGTYYGDALAWARNNLTITNDGTRQDVIVLLSDGDASATAMPTTTAKFGTISSVVTGLTLNGVNATDRGTKINSTLETPGTNAFPQTSGTCKSGSVFCGKTNNTYITKSSSTYKDQCKAAAQYADQLAEYLPKAVNGASIAEPKIFSFYYGSGTTGCSTDKDKAYTPCYTMQKIASDISNFYSVDSGCVLSRGNAQVKDISVAFGDMLRTILGGAGFKPRLVPAGF